MKGTTLPDGQLNAAGHRYVADAVSQWIEQNTQQGNGHETLLEADWSTAATLASSQRLRH
jgi:hypothetical protein